MIRSTIEQGLDFVPATLNARPVAGDALAAAAAVWALRIFGIQLDVRTSPVAMTAAPARSAEKSIEAIGTVAVHANQGQVYHLAVRPLEVQ
jgi:hypothetical protein